MKKKTTTRKSTSAKATAKSHSTALKSRTSAKKPRKPTTSTKKVTTPTGVRHHAKRLYHLTPKFIHGMVVGAFIGIIVLVPLGKVGSTNALSISSGQDCDTYSIINCGVNSTADLLAKYRASSYVQLAYRHMGISSADIASMGTTAVAGTVFDDGTVKVDGKVVAKDVRTEARRRVTDHDQAVTVSGATFYSRSLASSWSHNRAPAYVVMKNNVFQFAILAPCGNPIVGTPTTSPPPPPAVVKDITVCDLTTKTMVTIKETAFNTTHYSKNAADCNVPSIKVCDLTTLKVITIKADAFNSNTQSKDTAACTPPVGTLVVCDLTTKTMVTIKETAFDASKYSKSPEACQPPTPVVTETTASTLPNTGPGAVLIIFGASILGGYAFHVRHLHTKHKTRVHNRA